MKVVYLGKGEYGFETGDILTLVRDDGSTGDTPYEFKKDGAGSSWFLTCKKVRPATDADLKKGLPHTIAPPQFDQVWAMCTS